MPTNHTPPHPLRRIISLLTTGPRALFLRFYDQWRRKLTGAPDFRLTRVRPFLHVGGQHYRQGWAQMEAQGITAVLNMREAVHNDVVQGIGGQQHLQLATPDNTPVPQAYLHQAADFIKAQAERGGQVYVHCGVGVGRAPSAAAAYFIKHEGMTTAATLALIRKIRPFVHVTGSQRRALEQFEMALDNGRAAEA
jgi:predicted protein tyrosine phosphatase